LDLKLQLLLRLGAFPSQQKPLGVHSTPRFVDSAGLRVLPELISLNLVNRSS